MKFFKDLAKNKGLLLMALPGAAWFILFCYLPMFGLMIAFKDFKYDLGFLGSKWVGLSNFMFLFKTSDAFTITRNTVLYNLAFISLGLILAVMMAVWFDLLGTSKLGKFNQTVSIIPHFVSWVVASYFVYAILNVDMGIANNIITFLGGGKVHWYMELKYWPYILIFSHLWKVVGYNSIIYFATIRGFDVEYYEAARIDGATWGQQLWHITLPLLKPIVILMFILNIGHIMNSDFGLFYNVPKDSGLLYPVTSTIDTYVYNGITAIGNMGMTSAVAFYQAIVGFILVLTANAVVRKISNENALF